MVDPTGALSAFAEEMDRATKLTPALRASLMENFVNSVESGLDATTKDGSPDWKARLACMSEAKLLLRVDMKDQLALLARLESIVSRRASIRSEGAASALDVRASGVKMTGAAAAELGQ